jgi:hypothetical protein
MSIGQNVDWAKCRIDNDKSSQIFSMTNLLNETHFFTLSQALILCQTKLFFLPKCRKLLQMETSLLETRFFHISFGKGETKKVQISGMEKIALFTES